MFLYIKHFLLSNPTLVTIPCDSQTQPFYSPRLKPRAYDIPILGLKTENNYNKWTTCSVLGDFKNVQMFVKGLESSTTQSKYEPDRMGKPSWKWNLGISMKQNETYLNYYKTILAPMFWKLFSFYQIWFMNWYNCCI